MILSTIDSDFLRYLLTTAAEPQGLEAGARLPALDEISAQTGISVGKLREQLEVARALGLVEVSPRRGIRCRAYEFLPAVRLSLMIALSLDRRMFKAYSTLRIHLETAFWDEAVALLTEADREQPAGTGRTSLGQAQSGAYPDPPRRTPAVSPDDLQPPEKPLRSGSAGGVLGRVRGSRAEHVRRLQLSADRVDVSRAHRGRHLRPASSQPARPCWSSTITCWTRWAILTKRR